MKTNIIKGRKQLRSYDIPVDVYDREVYLYIGQTMADACFGAESEFKEFDLKLTENEPSGTLASAITITLPSGRKGELILLAIGESENHEILGILVHESLHTSWHILNTVGIHIEHENHEAQAYLLEYIFVQCKLAVEHYIKTYKLKIKL